MNKKILHILTGVSALAVAGLLSIIPASVAHASVPSQPVSETPTTITFTETLDIYDFTGMDVEPTSMPDSLPSIDTTVETSFELSLTGMNNDVDWQNTFNISNYSSFLYFSPEAQAINIFMGLYDGGAESSSSGNAFFSLTYNGNVYAGNIRLYPDSSNNALLGSGVGNYNYIPDVDDDDEPSTSDPVDSEDPVDTEGEGDESDPEVPEIIVGGGEVPDDKAFYEEIEKKVKEIALASQGLSADGSPNPLKVVEYKTTGAISSKIIKALMNSEGVTLIYTFEYEGIIFRSVITSESARAMYSETIDWYGPCYVAIFCPPVPIGLVK